MSLAETLQNRKNLERAGKLPHDTRFDDLERRANRHVLIVVAVLVAMAYAAVVNIYYRMEYATATEAKILAKSEMSKAEIKALNLAKVTPERRK